MTYYDRVAAVHLDGSPIFKAEEDERAEQEIAALVANRWGCAVRSFGKLSPIDWYAERAGRVVGLLELKNRSHESTRFPTVFLNVRKYLALLLGALGMGVPGVFIVRFTDRVLWMRLADIDAGAVRMGGCLRLVKSRNDIEPVIHVPVAEMHALKGDDEGGG